MYAITTNESEKNIIKHKIYKLNEQQYFEMETEMDAWSIFEP